MSKSVFKNYIHLIFALWLSLNYCYLQFSLSAYHPIDLMSSNSFLLYIAFSYSQTTIGYFLWLIWHNKCGKTISKTIFKAILSASVIILIIGATYWMYSVYGEWDGYDSAGNNITVQTNPALVYFRWIQLCAYIPCIIITVLFYWKNSNKTKNSHPIISNIVEIIVLLIIYGLSSSPVMVILGIPFVCLPVMLKNGIIYCNKYFRLSVYLFVMILILMTMVVMALFEFLDASAPVCECCLEYGYDLYALLVGFLWLLFFANVWFYLAVFVGFIFIGITKLTKFNFENPFSRGFKIGVICFPILLFVFIMLCRIYL